jgi:ABC-type transport system involved in multi-copper enzyme maturation permease subunit
MPELNPVLVKELRGRMRGARAFVLLTVYLIILSLAMLLLYTAVASSAGTDLNAGRRIGQALFYGIAAVALIEVCVITPALTAGSIAGEKERQTYDLLVSSLLSPWQIVLGKLGAALAFALLLILAVVPLMSLAFLFGGVSLAQVIILLAGLVATAVFYACVGLFWSAAMRSTLGANSFALGTIIAMLLGIPFIAVVFTLIFGSNSRFWSDSPLIVYLGGAFISSHPFIALLISDQSIRDGRGVFFSSVSLQNGQLLVPSPWLAFIALALLFSLALILLSVRLLRPGAGQEAPRGRAGKSAEEATP